MKRRTRFSLPSRTTRRGFRTKRQGLRWTACKPGVVAERRSRITGIKPCITSECSHAKVHVANLWNFGVDEWGSFANDGPNLKKQWLGSIEEGSMKAVDIRKLVDRKVSFSLRLC